MTWADITDAVAVALAHRKLPAVRGETLPAQSLLTAVTAATPRTFRRHLELFRTGHEDWGVRAEPLIFLNDLPPYLLSNHVVDVAAAAVTDTREALVGNGADVAWLPASLPDRVLAVVVVSALSTLRLDPADEPDVLDRVSQIAAGFDDLAWTTALDSLARRTAELQRLLAADSERRQGWRGVASPDRILAEAVAAAVVGGAAKASGVPPWHWLFPFHIFCKLGVSAADDALDAIERWIGVEFHPAPHTPERLASMAALVAGEAMELYCGCACKQGIDAADIAYIPRGPCRQADHDLAAWQPGAVKPTSRDGGRFAATLWGWLRRWLGGADIGRAGGSESGRPRPRLRPNDVAGSVLARRWLSEDRGGGPLLIYDRILPEFCLNCERKVRVVTSAAGSGQARVRRASCCDQPRRVYRSEFSNRNGRRMLRPKLGIVIVSPTGIAGYSPTTPLGPLWLCSESGRYSLSADYCPDAGCGTDPHGSHEQVHHGWVLLPFADAWDDLMKTAAQAGHMAGVPARARLSNADLRFLRRVMAELAPGSRGRLELPADIWAAAKQWSASEAGEFRELAGLRGLELLLTCKRAAESA